MLALKAFVLKTKIKKKHCPIFKFCFNFDLRTARWTNDSRKVICIFSLNQLKFEKNIALKFSA